MEIRVSSLLWTAVIVSAVIVFVVLLCVFLRTYVLMEG